MALDGKAALVTGAGRGIGRAIARAYADNGAAVACAARTAAEVTAVADAITASGGRAIAVPTDVTDEAQVEAMFERTLSAFGQLDLVVINAGEITAGVPLTEENLARFEHALKLNVIGAWLCARAAVPHLKAAGGGKLLFTGSGSGHRGGGALGAYSVSKAGMSMLVEVLARELRPHRIAVNELLPGPTRTLAIGFPSESSADEDANSRLTERLTGDWLKNPEDVAPLAVFLADLPDDGPSGQVFNLSGGPTWAR